MIGKVHLCVMDHPTCEASVPDHTSTEIIFACPSWGTEVNDELHWVATRTENEVSDSETKTVVASITSAKT
jgi:hypothetical protein